MPNSLKEKVPFTVEDDIKNRILMGRRGVVSWLDLREVKHMVEVSAASVRETIPRVFEAPKRKSPSILGEEKNEYDVRVAVQSLLRRS